MAKKKAFAAIAVVISAALVVLVVLCVGKRNMNSIKRGAAGSAVPIFNPDYSELVSRSNLTYDGMIESGTQGMPVANGRFGGPVWESSKRTLSMQLNHTDTFMYNDASAQSTNDSGGLGRLEIDFGGDVFDENTSQELNLYEGRLSVWAKDIEISVIADNALDAVLIHIQDNREKPENIAVTLNMLRDPCVVRGLFSADSHLTVENNDSLIVLEQTFKEQCSTGISENDFYCGTAAAVRVVGRDYNASLSGQRAAKLEIPAQTGDFTVVIGGFSKVVNGDIEGRQAQDVKQTAIDNAVGVDSYEDIYSSNLEWWADFWSKSYVYLPQQPEFEQRRTYYMYLAAISNRGTYPSKYNGGIWIAEGDRRDWGNWYWNWNQDSLYQPLGAANHGELLDPLFSMRELCYERYKTAAEQLWGINSDDALFIGETCGVLGHEKLSDSMAEDIMLYLKGEGEITHQMQSLGDIRNNFLVPWNHRFWGGGDISWITHTMVATQETAEYYWQRYEYTKDIDWLQNHAYKFIKGAAELYRNYYGFVKEDDGLYHFHRTNLHEHIWGGTDIIDDLSLARGIFAVAIKSSELLDTDEALRKEWQKCLKKLAPYPMSDEEDAICHEGAKLSDKPTWALGRQPASNVRGFDTETPQFKMLEKFDVLNLETRDQNKDKGQWEIALNTFYATPGYAKQYLDSIPDLNGSSRFLEDAAKLGLKDELAVMFHTQYKMFQKTPNLLHDQGDYYSAEGYGTWSSAIQQALNQSLSAQPGDDISVIRVFPAWPESWDAKYKLLAKGGFLVSSSIKSGDIEYIEIESSLGETCYIRNPWDSAIVLYRNGVESETIRSSMNKLVKFETEAGEDIVIVRAGTTPEQYRTSEVIR